MSDVKKDIELIYLAAASHSGSTLTAMLIGAHPGVSTVGELKINSLGNSENYKCSCLKKIKDCEFWNKIANKMNSYGERFNIAEAKTDIKSIPGKYVQTLLSPLHRGRILELIRDILLSLSPRWRKYYPKIQKRNMLLMRAITDVTGVNKIVDSSKIGIRLKYLLRIPNIHVRVIWIVRDGRGVSLAYKNPGLYADATTPELRGGGTGTVYEGSRDVKNGAKEWVRCNEEIIAALDTMPRKDWMSIHYEDLCRSPDNTLDKIFHFIEVDPDKKSLNFRSKEHHIVGNGMRLDQTEQITLDERWRTQLDKAELEIFEQIAGKMNKRLGYHG